MTLVEDGGEGQEVGAESLAHHLGWARGSMASALASLPFVADPVELTDVVADVVALRNQCEALITQYVTQVEACGAAASLGVRTAGQFVAAQTNADPKCFRSARARGAWVRDFPLFEDAFAAGVMSGSHVDLLRRHAGGHRTHRELQADQELFVDAARDCVFADFKKVVEYWLIAVDPDGEEPQEQKDRNHLSLRTGRGGRVFVRGELGALHGQALRTAVDRMAQQLRIVDREDGTIRTENQRQVSALVELIARGAARADGTQPVPLINIVMSQQVAEHLISGSANDPVPVKWNDVDGRCELIDGTPIHPRHALELFGVATFRRHVMDAKGRLIDVAVNARTFPQWMRNSLHIQARGSCETPGCDAPHRWIQADHVQPASRGGPTHLGNGQNQCAADNQAWTDTSGRRPWREHGRRSERKPQAYSRSGDRSGNGPGEEDH